MTGLIAERYRLLERLGGGAMGEVWRAHDERLDRTVAVKQLLPAAGLGETAARQGKERAMREARIAARLQHPHAVTVHDVVEHDGHPCLVMEYVPARSLSALLPLPPQRVARIGQQIAEALAAAHAAGIVHRDVKPGNVLLTADGDVKITDFGIARAVGDGSLTGPGIVAGTPAYLAPEVASGGAADFASDVFSLGATLYAAVEGAPPFGYDENPIALLQRVAEGRVPPPVDAGPLGPVLLWLLCADPAGRPTMARAAAALGAVADGRPVAPPTLHLPVRGPRGSRRRTVLAGLVAVGLVTAGLVTGILISADGRPAGITASGRPPTAHTRNIPAPTTPAPTTAPPSECTASYHVTGSWPGGFQATVTVNARTTLNGWQVTWDLPDGQTITNLWNGALSQQGTAVTVTNLPYNATPANGPITFGFNGGRTGTSAAPPEVRCTAHQ